MRESSYYEYLYNVQNCTRSRFKKLHDDVNKRYEEVQNELGKLKERYFDEKLDQKTLESEEKKRMSVDNYISVLESQINILNTFLEGQKLHNPNLISVKINPIAELKKMRY